MCINPLPEGLTYTVDEVIKPLVSTVCSVSAISRPVTTFVFIQHHRVRTLVDTGSSITAISAAFAQQLREAGLLDELEPWAFGEVTSADQSPLSIKGTVNIPIRIGNVEI